MYCDILKSKLILCEWNAFYFIEIAFIGFTLHEIKQCIVFFGTPGRMYASFGKIKYVTFVVYLFKQFFVFNFSMQTLCFPKRFLGYTFRHAVNSHEI